jgi:mono/diheme cytochrome c family protein
VLRIRTATAAAAAALVLLLAACGDDSADTATTATAGEVSPDPEQPLSPVEERGRMLFAENCGACHTLDAAGTNGTVGPNLDEAQLDEAEVLMAIEQGGREPGGPMPMNLVTGDDAKAVARFVANSGPGV